MKADPDKCCYCGGCVGICPENALDLREITLYIDKGKCKNCGLCAIFCPVGAITEDEDS